MAVTGCALPPDGATSDVAESHAALPHVVQLNAVALDAITTSLSNAKGEEREIAFREAYSRICPVLDCSLTLADREKAVAVLHRITDELFFEPFFNEFSNNHVVQEGESFDSIARNHCIGINLLWDLNKIPRGSKNLHPGDNLKVPNAAPRMVIRKSDFTTSLYFGDNLVRQYIVAHGQNNNTPVGSTSVTSMVIDPEKQARGRNDPRAEMKLRWIGWGTYANGRTGFGFHGTQNPNNIPGMNSRGCIRMRDHDVVELYDIVREGNKIDVRA
jgi:hypothetical protein